MPSRPPEHGKSRERVREVPRGHHVLYALLEILFALKALHPSTRRNEPFDIAFNDSGLLQFGGIEDMASVPSVVRFVLDYTDPPTIGTEYQYPTIKIELYIKNPDIGERYGAFEFVSDTDRSGRFSIKRNVGFRIETFNDYPGHLKPSDLVRAIEMLRTVLEADERYIYDYPLERAFDRFTQAVERFDQPSELVPQLMKMIEKFGDKIRELMKQVDSFKIALTESRQATAAAEAKALAAEARAEAAEAQLARLQYLTEGFEDWVEEEAVDLDLELDLDDEETPSGYPNDDLPGVDVLLETDEILAQESFWEKLDSGILGGLSWGKTKLWALIDWWWKFKFHVAIVIVSFGCHRFLDRSPARDALRDRRAIQVLVRDDGVTWEDLISVLYGEQFMSDDDSEGSDCATPLTEVDIQEGGDFYYGALAMEFLEQGASLRNQAYAALQDDDYRYGTRSWIRQFFDFIHGFPSLEDPILVNGTHRYMGDGAFGVNNFAWIYWGFAEGIHDHQMTVGHQLVLAALIRYPWHSDEQDMSQLKDGEIKKTITHPAYPRTGGRYEWKSLGNNRWEHFDYPLTINLNDPSWVNRQDDAWNRIKDRATQALNGLIKEGKIDAAQHTEIAEQIESARPWSWQYLDETFGPFGHGLRFSRVNPGEELHSIYDSPLNEALRELWTYELEPRNKSFLGLSDLRGEFNSMTLTLDPDIQAHVMRTETGGPLDELPYENGITIMVINDEGEIVGFFNNENINYLKHGPLSHFLANFDHSNRPRNWAFNTHLGAPVYITPKTLPTSCYVSSQWSHDLLGLIIGLRTGQPLPRPHIAHTFDLLNRDTFDMSTHWAVADNAAACAERLYADGENYQTLLDRLEPLSAGGHPYYMLSRSRGGSSSAASPKLHVAWTTVENGPTYTLVMKRPFDRDPDEPLIEGILEGIHDVWAKRNSTASN